MAQNFFQILLEAILDENASAGKIKQQVDNLSKKAGALKLGTTIDPKEIQRLRSEIAQIQKELASENLTTKQRSALLTELNQKQRILNAESKSYNQQEKADLAHQRGALSQIAAAQKDIVSIKRSQSQLSKIEKAEEEQVNSTMRERVSLLSTMKTWRFKQTDNTMSKTGLFGDNVSDIRSAQSAYENLYTSLQNGQISVKDARVQFQLLKDELTQLSGLSTKSAKIEMAIADDTYSSKVDTLIGKTIQWTDANGNARISTDSLQTALNNLNTAYVNITSSGGNTEANQRTLIEAERALDMEIKKVTNSVNSMNATMAKSSAIDSLRQKYQAFYDNNSAAHRTWGAQLKAGIAELTPGAEMSIAKYKQLEQQLIQVGNAARQAGKLGKSFFDTLKSGMKTFSYWTSSTFLVMKTIQTIKKAVTTVKELDTALVDLRKTTTMTSSQLKDFYYSANETAKQMGVSTKEIIDQAAAWSRLGYSSQEAATKMAKYSSWFASISPGMNIDKATDGLVSVMKAFDIGNDNPDEVLDGIMSKINIIGNTAATSNDEIVTMLEKSSSAMKEANNSLEETIALQTAAVEITRNAENVGTAFKTVSMRIRGYDEETESYTEDLENLSGKIADLTKTASTPGGISLFTDASKTEYKSTYQLLKEISEVYDEIDDKNQAKLLEALEAKSQGQDVAAAINNFEAAEKAMNNMANSAGSAEREMTVIMDSIDYKANKLAETGTGIAQNLFAREDMKTVLDVLTDLAETLDWVTEKVGLFGTIGLGAGLFAGIKNFGRPKMFGLCFEIAEYHKCSLGY